jgi:hypothetical protein
MPIKGLTTRGDLMSEGIILQFRGEKKTFRRYRHMTVMHARLQGVSRGVNPDFARPAG